MKNKLKQKFPQILTAIFIASFGFFVYANDGFNKAAFNDSDQDGLSDEEERMYGTDPKNPDTDGDGYSDGAEIKSGYDPLRPAPGDKILPEKQPLVSPSFSSAQNNDTYSNEFSNKFRSFLQEKGSTDISLETLNEFVTENIGTDLETIQQKYVLTEEEVLKIKTIKTDYSGLTEEEKLSKIKEAEREYAAALINILAVNIPDEIRNLNDITSFYKNLTLKIDNLTSGNPDYAYFRALGNNLENANEQLKSIKVPETFFELHVKLLGVVKGFIGLRDPALPPIEDPIGQLIIYPKVMVLGDAASEFLAEFLDKISKI